MLEYRCRQLVELVFNMSTILLYDTLQATPPLHGWYCHQWTSVTMRATPAGSPASIVPRSRTFYHGTRAPIGPPKWHNPPGLSLGCSVATRNALITILSSRVILPIKIHKRGYYSTVLFFIKAGSYSQNILINANTNKYEQNQTILPHNFI